MEAEGAGDLVCGVLLDVEVGAVHRFAAIGEGFAGLVFLGFVRPLRRRVTDGQVALYLEEKDPSLQAAILSAIESIDYDSFTTRARVGTWARGRLMWSIWRNGTALPNGTVPLEPIIRWQGQTISRAEEMAS